MFICKSFSSNNLNEFSISNGNFESCAVQVQFGCNKIIIFGVYRNHQSIEIFTELFLSVLNNEKIRKNKVVLVGDFNLNLLDETNNAIAQYLYQIQSLNFVPTISQATRFPPNNSTNGTLIDHIYLNFHTVFHSGIIFYDSSDHLPIFIRLPNFREDRETFKFEFRDCTENSLEQIENELMEKDWNVFFFGQPKYECLRFYQFLKWSLYQILSFKD